MGFPVKKAEVAEALARHGEPNVEAVGFETFRSVVVERLLQRTPEVCCGCMHAPLAIKLSNMRAL
eukprot:356594-Chlamydomonas_euryale.AAC.9